MDEKIKPSSKYNRPLFPYFNVEPNMLRAATGVQKESNLSAHFFFSFNIEIGVGGYGKVFTVLVGV